MFPQNYSDYLFSAGQDNDRLREDGYQSQIKSLEHQLTKPQNHYKQQVHEIRELRAQWKSNAERLVIAEKDCAKHKIKQEKALQTIEDQKEVIDRLENKVRLLTTGEGFWPDLKVQGSKIPGAGEGLFASRPIPKGVVIGEYYGTPTYRMEVGDDSHVVWRKSDKSPVL
ncbi:SET domain-containing protein [Endozoicomonas numazuensis]|uniref:Uncharacterized protein n=1 Tax=Endozoicomonas numazuensis TaxID=1137799 RepID=A0A081NJV7_9GAMM|nr:hypothetical protein [Endozoicomonas numazuensis]KEQ18730.1 hypothetical protein GZ78_01110 [Endozoicomonas numazuensis]